MSGSQCRVYTAGCCVVVLLLCTSVLVFWVLGTTSCWGEVDLIITQSARVLDSITSLVVARWILYNTRGSNNKVTLRLELRKNKLS